ncbi:hypothetical protein [Mycoplasma procyoni]|uniref:hypothetical protein n=1 Tax=Mycoplasma procyoni TaxID=568784 RepID=UPI00197C1EDC|nr:hypothetical protein [Mycoplasma procyoni]MBN3534538.1 hypothetical protein [Mycoplasma procyoni]
MKRNIKIVAQLATNNYALFAFEEIKNENVLIYNKEYRNQENFIDFFKDAINELNISLKTKATEIFVYLKETKNTQMQIKNFSTEISVKNKKSIISKKEIQMIQEKAKNEQIDEAFNLVSFSTLMYHLKTEDKEVNTTEVPLKMTAKSLKADFSGFFIDKETYQKITNIFSSLNLKVVQILTNEIVKSQMIKQEYNSDYSATIINIDDLDAFVAHVDKSLITRISKVDFSFNNLIDHFKNNFGLSLGQITRGLKIFGRIFENLDNYDRSSVIIANLAIQDFLDAITQYFQKIALIVQKISYNNHKPLVLCGTINNYFNTKAILKNLVNKDINVIKQKSNKTISKQAREVLYGINFLAENFKINSTSFSTLLHTQNISFSQLLKTKHTFSNLISKLLNRKNHIKENYA